MLGRWESFYTLEIVGVLGDLALALILLRDIPSPNWGKQFKC